MLSIDVLLIVWAAFLLYRVADEAGAIRSIGQALPHLTADKSMQALLIGWVFATFLQGVGGFGVPVAVTAPVLVGLGFSPLEAVIIPSVGHAWAVTFGSLGSSFQALISATGLPEALLAGPSALFLGIAGLAGGLMAAHAAGSWGAVRRLFLAILVLGVVMGAVQYLVAVAGPWNISAFVGGLAGLAVAFPLARRTQPTGLAQEVKDDGKPLDMRALLVALSGYAFLILITLGVQLIPAVNGWLGVVSIRLSFPEVSTALGYVTPAGPSRTIILLRHTGTVLLYASIGAYLIYRAAGAYKPGAAGRIIDGTLRRVMSSSVSIASMVTMAVIMENAGMTEMLARGLAEGVGALFPIASPWIGALGAFMTGSNTNSNVVFAALQLRTAELLGYRIPVILAAQTAGAALASVIAPTKVVVGASTAGMAGREGDVMRRLLVYIVILVLIISVLALLGVLL
jgi:lactate permease